MKKPHHFLRAAFVCSTVALYSPPPAAAAIGDEFSVTSRLADGQEYALSPAQLAAAGKRLLEANWTIQEGAGRPLTKGTGAPLSDPGSRLDFPRNFNRFSGPDANSCAGCHNAPHGIAGGSGDFVANVAVLGQRFDFLTFDATDSTPVRGAVNELGQPVTMDTAFNSRATPGMFGGGYIEMLAREITADLRTLRDSLNAGQSVALVSKGISFGTLSRAGDGTWNVSAVQGIPASSLSSGATPPDLSIRPWHQAGRVISVREFTNNAMNHHHGIQTTERFGSGDADGDGIAGEMSRAEVTAASIFQAVMAPPGRVIPSDMEVEEANLNGERRFAAIGCAVCHQPALPLNTGGWMYSEPNPYNPPGNLRPGDAPAVTVNLTDPSLPLPRLKPSADSRLYVPAFTDFKLHDITSGPADPNRESLDMQHAPGSPAFFAGNSKFLTRRLWDCGKKPNHYHHGKYTTLRESILAHSGEALASRQAFEALSEYDRDSIIEFLKSLQVLPPGTSSFLVDENYQPRVWPPQRYFQMTVTGDTITIRADNTGSIYPVPLRYQLQSTADLANGPWVDVGTPSESPVFTVPKGPLPASFFRIRVLPP